MDARRGAGTGRGRAEPALKVESAYRRRRLQHQAAPHREKCRSAVRRRAGPPASNHQLFRARRKPSPALAEAATHGVVGLAPAPRPLRTSTSSRASASRSPSPQLLGHPFLTRRDIEARAAGAHRRHSLAAGAENLCNRNSSLRLIVLLFR